MATGQTRVELNTFCIDRKIPNCIVSNNSGKFEEVNILRTPGGRMWYFP